MKKFIALLRGMNVGGQKQIKMSTLKLLFEELRFHNVETYIQSGNVIFSSKEKLPEKLEQKISSAIKRKFGFDVRVMVLTPEEIEYVLNNNPFIKRKKESEKLYVTFLAKSPSDENINKLNAIDYSPEEYIIDGRYIYLFVPNGYGKAKLNNNLFESKLNASATTRNWKTVNKMFELSTSN
jgi:uncharacterized protein (DUF1697 family)